MTSAPARKTRFVFGDFTLSPTRRVLRGGGRELPLIRRYFDLLVLLLERRGEAVHRREIMGTVGNDVVASDGALSQAVRRRTRDDAGPGRAAPGARVGGAADRPALRGGRGGLAANGSYLGAMSLDFMAHSFPGSQVGLGPLARLLGETEPGLTTRTVIRAWEGLMFGSGLVLGLTRRPRLG